MPALMTYLPAPLRESADSGIHRSTVSGLASKTTVTRDSLYEEFAPLVRRLIRKYGADADLRQDLAGEIYCRFCAIVEAFDSSRGIPFHPYIVRQLTATMYTYARQQWLVRKREVALDPTGNGDISPVIDPTPAWVQALSNQQVISSLPEALAQLPERQRQVVIWRYYENRPFEEIAEMLNIQTSSARSLLRHGLTNLRKELVPVHCEDPE